MENNKWMPHVFRKRHDAVCRVQEKRVDVRIACVSSSPSASTARRAADGRVIAAQEAGRRAIFDVERLRLSNEAQQQFISLRRRRSP
jgi:hypothetical protein